MVVDLTHPLVLYPQIIRLSTFMPSSNDARLVPKKLELYCFSTTVSFALGVHTELGGKSLIGLPSSNELKGMGIRLLSYN